MSVAEGENGEEGVVVRSAGGECDGQSETSNAPPVLALSDFGKALQTVQIAPQCNLKTVQLRGFEFSSWTKHGIVSDKRQYTRAWLGAARVLYWQP